jgi:hypothetical protein
VQAGLVNVTNAANAANSAAATNAANVASRETSAARVNAAALKPRSTEEIRREARENWLRYRESQLQGRAEAAPSVAKERIRDDDLSLWASLEFGPRRVIRAIAYASCYVYSPAGAGEMCERSRLLRACLKAADETFMRKYARRVCLEAQGAAAFAGFFGSGDVLVPVPGSSPYCAQDPWPSRSLAVALLQQGVGGAAWTGLHRVRAVRKSATAAPGTRPTVSIHYESFHIEQPAELPQRIMLIDDVITKGRTLLAAASRVQEALPGVEVRAFALVRTLGLIPAVQSLLNPCRGRITWRGGDAHRSP